MKRLSILPFLLLAALILASCDHAEGHLNRDDAAAVTISRTWPASAIRELDVSEVDGSISVQAIQTDQISLVATARGDLELAENEPNRGLFETKIEGDTLHIGRKEHRRRGIHIPFIFGHDRMRIDYVLRVPPGVSLDVSTVNGRISTTGMEGETQAATVNGRIELESSGANEMTATTVNGKIHAKFLRSFHGAKFKTVNGEVVAMLPMSASFNVDLSQVNGDFEASFPLSIHSNPGSRRVSGVVNGGQHELKIVTVNGDVELGRLNQ